MGQTETKIIYICIERMFTLSFVSTEKKPNLLVYIGS